MPYALQYQALFATQADDVISVDILTDGGASPIVFEATGFDLQYIPSSDDPFEPIYASQIEVSIDVTDNLANAPDFTSLDDRKYYVKCYRGGNVFWRGFVLSDNVQMSFSTGRKIMTFNAICGLGLLQDVDLPMTGITTYRNTIATYITKALSGVGFPEEVGYLTSVGIFAATMDDTGAAQPFGQAYMSFNNFFNDEGWYNCLDTLKDILRSWGCRLFMSNGEWNIIQVNQSANATRYWTRWDSAGLYVANGTFTTNINTPTDTIFIGGDQLKIYQKGFNNFLSDKRIEYPANALFNADLKLFSGADATNWTRTTAGTGVVTLYTDADKDFNTWILAQGNVVTGAIAMAENTTLPSVMYGDQIKVQFRIFNTTTGTNPNCKIKLTIDAGVFGTFYLKNDNTWGTYTIATTDFYRVEDKEPGTLVNLEDIPPAPQSGIIGFGVRIDQDTEPAIIVGDFKVEYNGALQGVKLEAKINDTETYRKEIVFPHGYNADITGQGDMTPAFMGAITNEDGAQLYGWYMLERKTTETFASLAQLMFKNYINMFRKNIINVDGTIEGLCDALDTFTFTDTDPAQISTQGKFYLIGNGQFNLIPNEFQGTFLEVSNVNQEATIVTTYDMGADPGISFQVAGAATTSPAACALSSYTLTKYASKFLPVVNDVIYNEKGLRTTFNGGNLYWKFSVPYYGTTRSYRISSAGVITESNTC